MSRRTSIALVPVVALLCAGCGTLDNVKRPAFAPPTNPDAKVCRAYGGVTGDWEVISEYPWRKPASFLDYVIVPILAGGDLVCTAVGDTITLPYTLVEEGRRAFGRPGTSTGYVPTLVPESAVSAPATSQAARVPQVPTPPAASQSAQRAGAPQTPAAPVPQRTVAPLSYFATPN